MKDSQADSGAARVKVPKEPGIIIITQMLTWRLVGVE